VKNETLLEPIDLWSELLHNTKKGQNFREKKTNTSVGA